LKILISSATLDAQKFS